MREAIRASVEKIVVSEDGSLTLEVKQEGLLGTQTAMATSDCRGTGPILERVIQSGTGRHLEGDRRGLGGNVQAQRSAACGVPSVALNWAACCRYDGTSNANTVSIISRLRSSL